MSLSTTATTFNRRTEIVRWFLCFTLAATLHVAAAYLIAARISQNADAPGVDAPAVMLDLPESFLTSDAPALDLPPGPVMEKESEASPPKEETKPPETQSDVALPKPEPEPPRPEPPAEEKQATAPPPARTPPKSIRSWQAELTAHIERFKRYPEAARARGETGTATVLFTIDREGHVLRSSVLRSAGSARLDEEALAVLARAQPLPRPPGQLADDQLTFTWALRFNLK